MVSPESPPSERYEILGRIAVGGMAEIYLAKDVANDREVVLKRLMPGLQSDAEFVRMFYDEANIAARLRHPNIVTIHELGELDGSLFIAMELLEGVNLRELQLRLAETGRTMPVGLGVSVSIAALSALDYAHRFTDKYEQSLRLVHRDISPQNVVITFGGETKLLDFGVAKAEGRLHQTRAGLIKGKFAYMSPEQISGGTLDGRSDIFALGEVMYELFLKRHPFYAQADMDMLRAVLDDHPAHPNSIDPQLPKPLVDVILRALQKMPEDRYGTAGLMKKDLENFARDSDISLSQGLMARFVQDLFRERLASLRRARARNDRDALVQAMRVVDGAPAPRAAADAAKVEPAEASRYGHPEGRPQQVQVSPASAEAAQAGRFVARGAAGGLGASAQRYEKSDVFEKPKLDTPTIKQKRSELDNAELPTVMGELTADEMARLREAAASMRAGTGSPSGVTDGPALVPDPAESGPSAPSPSASLDFDTRPMPDLSAPTTPRAQTLVPDHDRAPDRGSLALFVVGLVAFIGAVAYAVYLLAGSK